MSHHKSISRNENLQALADARRWLAFTGKPKDDGGIDKAPKNPATGGNARLDNPATWGTREEAEHRARKWRGPQNRPGVGIALGDLGDGTFLCGVDLDGCLGPDGTAEPWAASILDRLDSYAEVSPSGKGVKAFFRVAAVDVPALRKAMGTDHRRAFKSGPHKGAEVHLSNTYYTHTGAAHGGRGDALRLVPAVDLLWLVRDAGPAIVRPPEAAGDAPQRAASVTRDESRSAVAYRLFLDLFRAGATEEEARADMERDGGPAGDWYGTTDDRQRDRAIVKAMAEAERERADLQADFDQCWTPAELKAARDDRIARAIADLVTGPEEEATPPALNGGRGPIMRGDRIVANQHNTTLFLGQNLDSILPALHRNQMTGRDEWRGGEVSDDDIINTRAALERLGIAQLSKELVNDAVSVIARYRERHPIRDALGRLHHDGTPRLDTWLKRYAGAEDSPYTRAVGRAFLISMIARVMQPGCKADHVMVLVGRQGAGKSSLCELLAGSEYYSGSLTSLAGTDKDSREHLAGIWLAEIVEMAPARRSENDEMKAFLTTNSDRLRLAYGRRTVTLKRQCVFVGTTNDDEFLRDPTGGRRFWPVHVGDIDLEGLARDRDQLLAEAVAAYHAGEQWHLDPAFEAEHARPMQEAALVRDSWVEDIAAWLEKSPQDDFGGTTNRRDTVTISDVLFGALGMAPAQHSMANQKRAGDVMRGLGWTKTHTRRGKVWTRHAA